jgi:hypothetical protein
MTSAVITHDVPRHSIVDVGSAVEFPENRDSEI